MVPLIIYDLSKLEGEKVEFSQLSNHDPYPFNQSDSRIFKAVMAVKFC